MNVLQVRQLEKYGEDGITYLNQSNQLNKYIQRRKVRSESGAATVRSRLNHFGFYIYKFQNKKPLDAFLAELKAGEHDPYELLAEAK